MDNNYIKNLAKDIRREIIESSYATGKIGVHLGPALSLADYLAVLYGGVMNVDPSKTTDENRDRFILSKGHAGASIYAALAESGFFPVEELKTHYANGSRLSGHVSHHVPGVDFSTGSLGHGLSVATGMAYAAKKDGKKWKTYVVLGDGECNEGSVWEAALFAPSQKLDNLIAIIDFNKWQATGRSEQIMNLSPLKEKWAAFGWQSYEINGHSLEEILSIFAKIPETPGKPTAIIAHTVKGKGVSFMEDDNNWHYRIPTDEDLQKAKQELLL